MTRRPYLRHTVAAIALLMTTLACSRSHSIAELTLTNPNDFALSERVVALSIDSIHGDLQRLPTAPFITKIGDKEVTHQITTNPITHQSSLLVAVPPLSAGDSCHLSIVTGTPTAPDTLVYGHLHPERDDDFTWENNRNGYRVFGPALEAKGEISSGIDYFAKRTQKIVLDQWYAAELKSPHAYHTDRGEGMDFYMVGHTLGLGGAAPIVADTLCFSHNFTSYKILERGPLRLTFELSYAPYKVGNDTVTTTHIISCDAYSYLNHHYITYHYSSDSTLAVGVGFATRENAPTPNYTDLNGALAYAQPQIGDKGIIFSGLVAPQGFERILALPHDLIGVVKTKSDHPVEYYSGGNWDHADFKDFNAWKAYIIHELRYQCTPIRVINNTLQQKDNK